MSLTLAPLLIDAGIDPTQAIAIRHAFVTGPKESGLQDLRADSADAEILFYTTTESSDTRRLPAAPPRFWAVLIKEGGDQARRWSVADNRGQIDYNDT